MMDHAGSVLSVPMSFHARVSPCVRKSRKDERRKRPIYRAASANKCTAHVPSVFFPFFLLKNVGARTPSGWPCNRRLNPIKSRLSFDAYVERISRRMRLSVLEQATVRQQDDWNCRTNETVRIATFSLFTDKQFLLFCLAAISRFSKTVPRFRSSPDRLVFVRQLQTNERDVSANAVISVRRRCCII